MTDMATNTSTVIFRNNISVADKLQVHLTKFINLNRSRNKNINIVTPFSSLLFTDC